jgi:hypothetical protein
VFRQDAGGYRGTEPDSTRYAGQQVSRWEIDFWFMGAWQNGLGDGTHVGCIVVAAARMIEFWRQRHTRALQHSALDGRHSTWHTRDWPPARVPCRGSGPLGVAQQRQGQQGAGVWGLLTGLARAGDSRNRYNRYGPWPWSRDRAMLRLRRGA